MKTKLRDKIFLRWVPLIIVNLFVLFPIVWAIITSLKQEGDILKKPIRYIPDPVTFENYIRAWVNCNFSRYFGNSMKIALVSVICIVYAPASVHSVHPACGTSDSAVQYIPCDASDWKAVSGYPGLHYVPVPV